MDILFCKYKTILTIGIPFILIVFFGCFRADNTMMEINEPQGEVDSVEIHTSFSDSIAFEVPINQHVTIDQYFDFIDNIVVQYDSLVDYQLSEFIIIHNNSWVIELFTETDYYFQKQRDTVVYDQRNLNIFFPGDILLIPTSNKANELLEFQNSLLIDVNIPEYQLTIFSKDKSLFQFPVRVGRNATQFLQTVGPDGRDEDLRTRTGKGYIYQINTDPTYMNPVDGKKYDTTLRDDEIRTKMPRIPFLFPEINGKRWGQLIHPTTNLKTLGKAYSNGCIGTGEAAAWIIYFHAPLDTKIHIRYELEIKDENGAIQKLKDIYQLGI